MSTSRRHQPVSGRRSRYISHALLAAAITAATLGTVATRGPQRVQTAAAATPTGIQKIQHVIVIMQENRSFDEYFGTFPGANGIPAGVCVNDPVTHVCVAPYHDSSDHSAGGPHTAAATAADINGGKMDGYIAQAEKQPGMGTCSPVPSTGTCTDVMSYHDQRELANYWSYASNFVLQDAMFEPVADWSLAAHLYMVSAWSAQCKNPNLATTCAPNTGAPDHQDDKGQSTSFDCDDFEPEPAQPNGSPCLPPDYGWTDITYLLHKAGISWKEYYGKGAPEWWKPLADFVTVHQDGELGNIQPVETSFFSDAAAGTLPAVSWVVPPAGKSEHPPSVSSQGQEYVTSLINAVMHGPNWDSTAIYVSWDDWGGFYDHVKPPTVDNVGYGLRVPGLLISPYARHGYIDHQTLSHDAYLKFIEDVFLAGKRIDPLTDGRPDPRPGVRENASILGDLAQEFDFTQTPRAPMVLPQASDTANQGAVGSKTKISGLYFAPNETVTFKMGCSYAGCTGATVIGTATADVTGAFSNVSVTIPAGYSGQTVIGVVGATGDFAETNFTVK